MAPLKIILNHVLNIFHVIFCLMILSLEGYICQWIHVCFTSVAQSQVPSVGRDYEVTAWYQIIIKGTGRDHDFVFQVSLFQFADFFAVYRPLLCTKLIHQSSPAEMIFSAREPDIHSLN